MLKRCGALSQTQRKAIGLATLRSGNKPKNRN